MKCKWTMIDRKQFSGEMGGYTILVEVGAAFGYTGWAIYKDGVWVDDHWKYPSCGKTDLHGKVAAERVVQKLLNSEQNPEPSVATESK